MIEFIAVIYPISFLALLVLMGFVSEKTHYVSNIKESLSKVITHITLPLLVITSLSNQEISEVPIFSILLVVGFGIFVIFLLIAINTSVGKLLKVRQERLLIHSFLGSFGNVIFLGYPVTYFLYGDIGLLYAIIFSMANELVVWTFGAFLLSRNSSGSSGKWSLKYLINPNTLSFIIGITMLMFDIRFPELINAPLERLGFATTPLSMLFIGSILARTELVKALKSIPIWSICLIKMLLIPTLFLLIITLFFPLINNISIIIISAVTLQMAMPSQANLSVLADRYNSDSEYAAHSIFITTLICSITIPIIYYLSINLL